MVKNSEEEVWAWYQHLEDWRESGLAKSVFVEREGLNYNKMTNMIFRIEYKRKSDPRYYEKLMTIGKAYLASGERLTSKYAKEHNIPPSHLGEILTHINYLKVIERKKAEHSAPMNFIQVPTVQSSQPRPPMVAPEAEVIEKQNDIELMITKGVRVLISPNIEPLKIIKIIELLKDL